MLHDESTAGQTFELYGPKNYSTAEIAELVDREIIKHRRHINVPKRALKPLAYYLNKFIWWPTMSADEVEREFMDQEIDPTAKTFKDLGIEPDELANLTFHYLVSLPLPNQTVDANDCHRKDTVALRTTICLLPRSGSNGKRRSTCTFWTASSGLCFFNVYKLLDSKFLFCVAVDS